MTPAKAPPEIFDTHRLTLARKRAAKRPQSFLLERCLEDLSERLLDVNACKAKTTYLGRLFKCVESYGPMDCF